MNLLNAVDLRQRALNFMRLIIFKGFFNLVFAVINVNLYLILHIERPHPLPHNSNIKSAIYITSSMMIFVVQYAFS